MVISLTNLFFFSFFFSFKMNNLKTHTHTHTHTHTRTRTHIYVYIYIYLFIQTHARSHTLNSITFHHNKQPRNFRNIGLINSMLPNSYIIHVRRDPLDTLWSCYKNRFLLASSASWSLDVKSLVNEYVEYLKVIDHYKSVLPENRIIGILLIILFI